MRIVLYSLANLKNLIMVGACLALFWFMTRNLLIALRETAPTPIQMERWAADYHGAQWLAIEGVAEPEWGAQNSGGTWFVPLVPAKSKKGDPIQVVVVTNAAWAREHSGRVEVSGVLAPPNAWRLSSLMPGYTFAPDVVCLNEGTEPDGIGAPLALLALGLVLGTIGGSRLIKSARGAFGGEAAEASAGQAGPLTR